MPLERSDLLGTAFRENDIGAVRKVAFPVIAFVSGPCRHELRNLR